jgi:hypothetical protein
MQLVEHELTNMSSQIRHAIPYQQPRQYVMHTIRLVIYIDTRHYLYLALFDTLVHATASSTIASK